MKKKILLTVCACALIVALSIAGTVAYLTSTPDAITNTFTVGKVGATLTETLPADNTIKMVPGQRTDKNPTAGVSAESEACYLFIRVQKSANYDTFISSSIAAGWTALAGHEGYYFKTVSAADAAAGVTYGILTDNKVTVKSTVTNEMMSATDYTNPTIAFSVCAIQSEGFDTAADAFAQVPSAFTA